MHVAVIAQKRKKKTNPHLFPNLIKTTYMPSISSNPHEQPCKCKQMLRFSPALVYRQGQSSASSRVPCWNDADFIPRNLFQCRHLAALPILCLREPERREGGGLREVTPQGWLVASALSSPSLGSRSSGGLPGGAHPGQRSREEATVEEKGRV